MVPIAIVYQGKLRCQAQHGPSKVQLITDAPVDNHGRGESFSPTDLVATGLGVCMATILGIVAERDKIAIDGLKVNVEKHMTTTPPRKIAKIVVAFSMPRGLTADQRKILERAAHTCPVALSLHPEIVQDVSFTYPD
jgi:putative redox protein